MSNEAADGAAGSAVGSNTGQTSAPIPAEAAKTPVNPAAPAPPSASAPKGAADAGTKSAVGADTSDVGTSEKEVEKLPSSAKDPAVFRTAHTIYRFNAIGHSRDTLVAMLVIFETEKSELLEKTKKLEKELTGERDTRISSEKTCVGLKERLGSPSVLMSGILTLISTISLAVLQPFPTGRRYLVIFGCAIMAGLASVGFAAISYFKPPKVN